MRTIKITYFAEKKNDALDIRYEFQYWDLRSKDIYGEMFQLITNDETRYDKKVTHQQKKKKNLHLSILAWCNFAHLLIICLEFAIDYSRCFTVLACVFIHQVTRQVYQFLQDVYCISYVHLVKALFRVRSHLNKTIIFDLSYNKDVCFIIN